MADTDAGSIKQVGALVREAEAALEEDQERRMSCLGS
jgi:hypothetical protein